MKKLFKSMMAIAIAACTFTACEDVPEPYNNPYNYKVTEVIAPKGTGIQADPFNVAAALAKCQEVGETGTTEDVYAEGYVASITELSTQYGNATFMISDVKTGGDMLTVYRAKGPNNEAITDENIIKVGDKVLVCGKLVNFKSNTPEFTQGCYIVSINGAGGGEQPGGGDEPGGDETIGTEKEPITVADALTEINKLGDGASTSKEAYVKGKISQIKGYYNSSVITYYISDDGQTTNEVQIYNGKNIGNTDFAAQTDLAVGMEVVVKGKLKKFVNKSGVMTPEIDGGVLISKDGEGGGEDPEPGTGGDEGTKAEKSVTDNVVTLTNASATESADVVTVDFNEQGFTDKAAATTVTLNDETTITFGKGENTTAPTFYANSKGVRVYAKNTITINGKSAIAKVVMTCDVYNETTYIGNEMLYGSINGNQFTIVNDHTEAKGGVQLRVQTITITYAQ